MEHYEHTFLSDYLSVPTIRARFLVDALDIEHRWKSEEREPDNLRYLDLATNTGEEVNTEGDDEYYDKVCMYFFMQHEKAFHRHYLEESNDLKKYLYKYLSLQLKIFSKVPSLSPYYDFNHILHLMYNEDINDGMLLRGFLLLVECKWQIKRAVKQMEPKVLEFLLHNIKVSGIGSYEFIQEVLPLNICGISGDLMKINILLKFGHEKFFTEEYYAPSICVGWEMLFGEAFLNVQIGISSLKRLYLILMTYAAFLEMDSGSQDAIWTIVKVWRALPEPFLTRQEISDTIGMLVPSEAKKRFENFCLEHEEIFGNVSSTPRSLKHLARCAIRGQMSQNARLPEAVWNLHIPMTLKNYLSLKK